MSDLSKYLGVNALACTIGGIAGFFSPIPGGAAGGCGLGLLIVNTSRCGTEAVSQTPDMPSIPESTVDQYEKVCQNRFAEYCQKQESFWQTFYGCDYYYPKSRKPEFSPTEDLKTQWADYFLQNGLCAFTSGGESKFDNGNHVACEEGKTFKLSDGSYHFDPFNPVDYTLCVVTIPPKE